MRAAELARRGLAELENEAPGEAAPLYRELSELRPADPLGPANLAIAQLRQQEIEAALEASAEAVARAEAFDGYPSLGQVLAIRGAVLDWQGEVDEALVALERAARAAPDDPEVVYGFYRLASLQGGPELSESADWALGRLTELRPENVVVLLQAGRRAVETGDRPRATAAYGRIAELVWQAPPAARTVLDDLLAALEAAPADGAQAPIAPIDDARLPAARLENVLKITPMYRESLRELATGIQGVPLTRLADQPPPTSFGSPVPVTFQARRCRPSPPGPAVWCWRTSTATGDRTSPAWWTAPPGGWSCAWRRTGSPRRPRLWPVPFPPCPTPPAGCWRRIWPTTAGWICWLTDPGSPRSGPGVPPRRARRAA